MSLIQNATANQPEEINTALPVAESSRQWMREISSANTRSPISIPIAVTEASSKVHSWTNMDQNRLVNLYEPISPPMPVAEVASEGLLSTNTGRNPSADPHDTKNQLIPVTEEVYSSVNGLNPSACLYEPISPPNPGTEEFVSSGNTDQTPSANLYEPISPPTLGTNVPWGVVALICKRQTPLNQLEERDSTMLHSAQQPLVANSGSLDHQTTGQPPVENSISGLLSIAEVQPIFSTIALQLTSDQNITPELVMFRPGIYVGNAITPVYSNYTKFAVSHKYEPPVPNTIFPDMSIISESHSENQMITESMTPVVENTNNQNQIIEESFIDQDQMLKDMIVDGEKVIEDVTVYDHSMIEEASVDPEQLREDVRINQEHMTESLTDAQPTTVQASQELPPLGENFVEHERPISTPSPTNISDDQNEDTKLFVALRDRSIILVYNGFHFSRCYVEGFKIRWQCVNQMCAAYLYSVKNKVTVIHPVHNHLAKLLTQHSMPDQVLATESATGHPANQNDIIYSTDKPETACSADKTDVVHPANEADVIYIYDSDVTYISDEPDVANSANKTGVVNSANETDVICIDDESDVASSDDETDVLYIDEEADVALSDNKPVVDTSANEADIVYIDDDSDVPSSDNETNVAYSANETISSKKSAALPDVTDTVGVNISAMAKPDLYINQDTTQKISFDETMSNRDRESQLKSDSTQIYISLPDRNHNNLRGGIAHTAVTAANTIIPHDPSLEITIKSKFASQDNAKDHIDDTPKVTLTRVPDPLAICVTSYAPTETTSQNDCEPMDFCDQFMTVPKDVRVKVTLTSKPRIGKPQVFFDGKPAPERPAKQKAQNYLITTKPIIETSRDASIVTIVPTSTSTSNVNTTNYAAATNTPIATQASRGIPLPIVSISGSQPVSGSSPLHSNLYDGFMPLAQTSARNLQVQANPTGLTQRTTSKTVNLRRFRRHSHNPNVSDSPEQNRFFHGPYNSSSNRNPRLSITPVSFQEGRAITEQVDNSIRRTTRATTRARNRRFRD